MSIVHRLVRVGLFLGIVVVLAACGSGGTQAPPLAGAAAPDFSLPTLDGGSIRLADTRGKVVIVNFWASWCAPCVAETPRLVGWYAQHRDSGLLVLGVDVLNRDSRADVETFITNNKVDYPVPLDEPGDVSARWRAQQLPRSYVIDRDGIVRLARIGELTDDDFETSIRPLLAATQ
jgi:peroxiredoxin